MCVFLLALQPSSPYILVAANNRDMFFSRNTAKAAFWDDHPNILAGNPPSEGAGGAGFSYPWPRSRYRDEAGWWYVDGSE